MTAPSYSLRVWHQENGWHWAISGTDLNRSGIQPDLDGAMQVASNLMRAEAAASTREKP